MKTPPITPDPDARETPDCKGSPALAGSPRELAERVATRLFANGFGGVGTRLEIKEGDGYGKETSLGGWCFEAAVDQIAKVLEENSYSPRVDDTGVLRQYFEAAPNPMFSEVQRACIRFVRYKEKVPCALCGKQSKKHWTCVVRFKAADLSGVVFEVKMPRRWTPAGKPVCEDHPLQPDEREFMRKVRAARRQANDNSPCAGATEPKMTL